MSFTEVPDFTPVASAAARDLNLKPLLIAYFAQVRFPPHVVKFELDEGRAPDGFFHPSTHPLWEPMLLYQYLVNPTRLEREPIDLQSRIAITMGSAIHSFVQSCMRTAGWMAPFPAGDCPACGRPYGLRKGQCDEFGVLDERLGRRGHMDGVLAPHITTEFPAFEFKDLDISTPMLTPSGWTTMGDLRAGDEVYAPDGQPTKVLAAHPVLWTSDCYRVRFADGQSLVAGGGHLWEVTETGKWGGSERRVITTDTIRKAGLTHSFRNDARSTYRWRIDLPSPLGGPDVDLPIDPYLLGAWLGDGNSKAGRITSGAGDLPHLLCELDRIGEIYRVSEDKRTAGRVLDVHVVGLTRRLKEAGVFNAKRIPPAYFTSSEAQRRALLAGIMDTDGTATTGHQLSVSMVKEDLMEDILVLARSLGYRATLRTFRARLDGNDAGPFYRVQFSATEVSPFRMARKTAAIWLPSKRTRSTYNAIVAIEPVPIRPTRCITVAHESGCFLAGSGLLPTHNTNSGRLYDVEDNDLEWYKKKHPGYYAQNQEYLDISGLPGYTVLFQGMGYPWSFAEIQVPYDPEFAAKTRTKYELVRKAVRLGEAPDPCCTPRSKKTKNCPATACPVKTM